MSYKSHQSSDANPAGEGTCIDLLRYSTHATSYQGLTVQSLLAAGRGSTRIFPTTASQVSNRCRESISLLDEDVGLKRRTFYMEVGQHAC
jgi:hypothetical protein